MGPARRDHLPGPGWLRQLRRDRTAPQQRNDRNAYPWRRAARLRRRPRVLVPGPGRAPRIYRIPPRTIELTGGRKPRPRHTAVSPPGQARHTQLLPFVAALRPELLFSAAGRVGDVVEVDVFEDRVEVVAGRVGLRAEFRGGQLVLDVEHGFAVGARPRLQPRGRVVALAVLPALLVDREIEVRLEIACLAEVVFQADREPLAVRQVGDRGVELLLGGRADGQAGVVLVGVHVVEFDRIHAQRLGLVQPRRQLIDDELLRRLGLPGAGVDAGDVGVDVQPVLISEAADRLAEQAAAAAGVEAGVLRMIRPPGFRGSGVDVADHLVPLAVQRVDRRAVEHAVVVRRIATAVLVDVNVEHRRRDRLAGRERRAGDRGVDESGARVDALAGGVDRALQLVLPGGDQRGLPARTRGSVTRYRCW